MDSLTALAAAALLIRVGLAIYVAGLSRAKNAAGAVMRSLCDLSVSSLAFWAIGAAILFQNHNAYFGIDPHLLVGWSLRETQWPVFLFMVIALIPSAVVGGAVGERSRFFPLCVASAVLAGVVVPV